MGVKSGLDGEVIATCNVFGILKQSVYRISCPCIVVVPGLSTTNCLCMMQLGKVRFGWRGDSCHVF